MKILSFLIVLMFSLPSFAELTCSAKGTKLIYVNGVRTEKWEADDAMIAMYNLIPLDQIDKQSKVKPVLSYNYTYGFARDLLEVIIQRFPAQFLKENGFKDGYAAYMKFMQGKLLGLVSPLILDEIVNSTLEAEAALSNYTRDETNLKTHYQAALDDGFKVLAIRATTNSLIFGFDITRAFSIFP